MTPASNIPIKLLPGTSLKTRGPDRYCHDYRCGAMFGSYRSILRRTKLGQGADETHGEP